MFCFGNIGRHPMRGSRKVRQGGGGGVQVSPTKKSSDNVFFFFFFFSPQLILLKSNGQFFKVPEGVQHFPGGVQLYPGGGGVQLLILYRNPYRL